jgi:hypothetical protein
MRAGCGTKTAWNAHGYQSSFHFGLVLHLGGVSGWQEAPAGAAAALRADGGHPPIGLCAACV